MVERQERSAIGKAILVSILVIGVACTVVGVSLAIWKLTRPDPDATIRLWSTQCFRQGKGDVRIYIGSNGSDVARVVVIQHHPLEEGERRVLQEGVVYSSDDPVEGLKSNVSIATAYPADAAKSGLRIDGRSVPLTKPLTVVFTSNTLPATEIDVPEEERDLFLDNAKNMDPYEFVETHVLPRLPVGKDDVPTREQAP